MAKKQSDKVEYARRVRSVQEWILKDCMTADIVAYCIQSWGVSDRQARRYISEAYASFKESNERSAQQKLNYYISRKKKLLRDMNDDEKKTAAGVAAASRVLDSMALLEGVMKNKVEITGKDGKDLIPPTSRFENLTTEQLEALVEKLAATK